MTTKKLVILAANSNYRVRLDVAMNPRTPVTALKKLVTDPEYCVSYHAGCHPTLSKRLLTNLAKQVDSRCKAGIAANPNASAKLLEELASDPTPEVRIAVAHNQKTPKKVLKKLYWDMDCAVSFEAIAFSTTISMADLVRLANSPDPLVRCGVATNLKTPAKLLKKLSTDISAEVRELVAEHQNTPKDILDTLANDSNEEVAEMAKHYLA